MTMEAGTLKARLLAARSVKPNAVESLRMLSKALGTMDDPKQRRVLEQVIEESPSRASLFARCFGIGKKASARQRVKAFCLDCVGLDTVAITECTATSCTLWPIRPFQPRQ